MVESLRRLQRIILWVITLLLPMLSGFFIIYFSLHKPGANTGFSKWLYLLTLLIILTAIVDMRCNKFAAQREEASNVQPPNA